MNERIKFFNKRVDDTQEEVKCLSQELNKIRTLLRITNYQYPENHLTVKKIRNNIDELNVKLNPIIEERRMLLNTKILV